ncbi:unnamed protein product [Chilo suppressalis]|uniref:Gustatory receptor n=1 Tax=Chilo suppressalis TaxID=168631 RepID=A0ABN8BDT1_CHISP|nr:unnamed protein product [Chilo suppressalis]
MKVYPAKTGGKNFYFTTRVMFLFCKCSGLFPVNGLLQKTSRSLGFSWFSINFILCAISIIAQYTLLIVFTHSCLNFDTISQYSTLALWIFVTLGPLLFFNFSRKFTKMIEDIETLEAALPKITNNVEIRRKINLIAVYIAVTVLVNIAIIVSYIIQDLLSTAVVCQYLYKGNDNGTCMDKDRVRRNACLYTHVPYSHALTFVIQLVRLQGAFLWNISSGMIIACCIYLENLFQNFNDVLIEKSLKMNGNRVNWNEMKAHYTNLSELVRKLDHYINPITFVTFFTNMTFICQLLFLVIGRSEFRNYRLFFSTGLTVIKIGLMLFTSAQLHTTSRKPLELLGSIPRAIYTYETQQFMEQVYHSKVAISGFELFYFTKETILTVCSVIVTYELMLFQM